MGSRCYEEEKMNTEHIIDVSRRKMLFHIARISAGIAAVLHLPPAEALEPMAGASSASFATSRRRAQIFALDAVQLDAGPFQEAMERNRLYLLSLDPDRFLHYYRTTAGLPARADVYTGSGWWENSVGRMLGHYLSACSMYVKSTGAQEFQRRQDYIVGELATCQKANGDGYVGGIPDSRRIFREISAGNIYIDNVGLNGVHAPWYMLHKMCAGLRDAYVYGNNQQALSVLTGFSDWCVALTDPLSDAQMQKMVEDEVGGINEIFADMAALTGKSKYMTLSTRFNLRAVLDPLTKGVDNLDGVHGNTTLAAVIGLYRQYELTGDPAAHRGGEFFWQTMTQNRSYVNGGNTDDENFYPVGQMGKHLTPATAETCNSYNMVKLTDRLFADTPREEVAAFDERILWNHILASQDKSTSGMTYFVSLAPGHFKTFSKPEESFWCCVGTGMENHAKYGESLYFNSASELWINQFVASTVHWKEQKMRIVQSTKFPIEQQSQWKLSCDSPTKATIYLRHPKWAGGDFVVKVNGTPAGSSEPGTYLKLERTWHDGDVITASLPMRLRIETMKDDQNFNAILYGPLVLAGLLGRDGMPTSAPYATSDQLQYRSVPDPMVPAVGVAGQNVEKWLKQTGPVEFATNDASANTPIRFVPLANITNERYSVYWRLRS
jgi:uncharacterized protein